MDEEAIKNSIELLRARRQSIGDLRDYKPQRGGKKSAPKADVDVGETFAGLIQAAEE